MKLGFPVGVTDAGAIRSVLRERIAADGLELPPVELLHYHVFIHCVGGRGRHMVDFQDYDMTPGTAIWIRPGQVQRWDDENDGFDANVMAFDSSAIRDLPFSDRFIGTTGVTDVGDDSDTVRQLMESLRTDLDAHHDSRTAGPWVSVILHIFARTFDHSSITREEKLTKEFVSSIESNLGQRFVAWHASNIGASTRSVARATRESLGQRPKEVIDARVVLEARRRLAGSDDNVTTIAHSLGFSDASNFSKYFHAHTGVSPSEFRDSVADCQTSTEPSR